MENIIRIDNELQTNKTVTINDKRMLYKHLLRVKCKKYK